MPHDMLTTHKFVEEVIADFANRFSIDEAPAGPPLSHDQIMDRAIGCRALLPTATDRIDDAIFERAPSLCVVANVGVGYNHIDVASASRHGVWVTNTPGVLTDTVADLTMALLLGALRRVSEASEHVRHGNWRVYRMDQFWGTDAAGLTLGIYGLGAIGQAVARRARPFGMRVIYHNRTQLPAQLERELEATYVPFDTLLEISDVLSVHVPLTDETRGRIGRNEMDRMRRGVFIINTSRGPVIDEAALIDALESGRVAGVGLDVTATEPDVPRALREHPAALILPHVGSATRGTRGKMMRMALENAAAVLEGRTPPPNAVNAPKGD